MVSCSKRAKRQCLGAKVSCQWAQSRCRVNRCRYLVSYTLFGNSLSSNATGHEGIQHRMKTYILGLQQNCERIKASLPAFGVRLYLSSNLWVLYKDIFQRISKQHSHLSIVLVKFKTPSTSYAPTLWRFLPLFDRTLHTVLVRDLDDQFVLTSALENWIYASNTPIVHRQQPRGGHYEITNPDPKHKRIAGDEYAISAGWVGRKGAPRTTIRTALSNMKSHVATDTAYCTDERWLLGKGVPLMLGTHAARHPWNNSIARIHEDRPAWDFEADVAKEGRLWRSLMRQSQARLGKLPERVLF